MKKSSALVLFFVLSLNSLMAFAVPEDRAATITDSLTRMVARSRTASDSLLYLCNLFDIAQSRDVMLSDSLASQIFEIARHNGNNKLALEMLRHRSNNNLNRLHVLEQLLTEAEVIEATDPSLLKETSTYLRMSINNWFHLKASESERRKRFEEELKRWKFTPPTDIYDQIVLLHSVCLSLSQRATGELLKSYTDELRRLIEKLPPSQYSLRNSFYIQAAINYYNSGFPDEGLKSDEKILDILDSLDVTYRINKRPYRQYDRYRFVIYCRALSSYENISPEMVETFYAKAKKFRNLSPRAQNSRQYSDMMELYYAMAHKRYDEATPYIKSLLNTNLSRLQRQGILDIAVKCAEKTGDKELLLAALKEQNDILRQTLETGLNEKVRELQIIYDKSTLEKNIGELELAKIESENQKNNILIYVSLAVIIILLIGVIVVIRLYRNTKKLARSLAESNAALSAESQRLLLTQGKLTRARDEARQANQLKSDFIRNISHELTDPLNAVIEYSRLIVDCTETTGKAYLANYADMVSGNAMFLSAVFNDVFRLSENDTENMVIMRREMTDINALMKLAIETVKPGAAPDVDIFIKPESKEITTMVDPNRLLQILMNLLRNSIEYTRQGMIVLSCGMVNDGSKVAISVTDTGSGVEPEIVDHIFERGVTGKNSNGGVGLGLPISLMMAHLMGGDLIHDTSYTGGARFVITIPFSMTK